MAFLLVLCVIASYNTNTAEFCIIAFTRNANKSLFNKNLVPVVPVIITNNNYLHPKGCILVLR